MLLKQVESFGTDRLQHTASVGVKVPTAPNLPGKRLRDPASPAFTLPTVPVLQVQAPVHAAQDYVFCVNTVSLGLGVASFAMGGVTLGDEMQMFSAPGGLSVTDLVLSPAPCFSLAQLLTVFIILVFLPSGCF